MVSFTLGWAWAAMVLAYWHTGEWYYLISLCLVTYTTITHLMED